jgi:hypothetical protein
MAQSQLLHVEPLEFTFTWMENGDRKTLRVEAENFPEACWKLGAIHLERFAKRGVPKDFELDLISQEPR